MGPSERSGNPAADGILVAAVRRGDDRGFERLLTRYHGPVIAYVRSRVGERELAEDLAQEIFISALRGMRATDRPIVFKPWIYEIARNACIDQHRRRARHAELARLKSDLVELNPSADPEAALELRQRLAALCLAFGELPAVERELLAERELAGRPYAELASCAGLTVSAVESALHRGRRRLLAHYRLLTGERPPRPALPVERRTAAAPNPVWLWDTAGRRGVAQPGSAHRSGR